MDEKTHQSNLDKLFGEGSSLQFENQKVRTVKEDETRKRKKVIKDHLNRARELATSGRTDDAVEQLQFVFWNFAHEEEDLFLDPLYYASSPLMAQLNRGIPKRPEEVICTLDQMDITKNVPLPGSLRWSKYHHLIEEDTDFLKAIIFAVTGCIDGKIYTKIEGHINFQTKKTDKHLNLSRLTFIDNLFLNGKGEKLLNLLSLLSEDTNPNFYIPLIFLYFKCITKCTDKLRLYVLRLLPNICDVPLKYSFLLSLSFPRHPPNINRQKKKVSDRNFKSKRKRKKTDNKKKLSDSNRNDLEDDHEYTDYTDDQEVGEDIPNQEELAIYYKHISASLMLFSIIKMPSQFGNSHKRILKSNRKTNLSEMKSLLASFSSLKPSVFQRVLLKYMENSRIIDGEQLQLLEVMHHITEIRKARAKPKDLHIVIDFLINYKRSDTMEEHMKYCETKYEFNEQEFYVSVDHIPERFLKFRQVWECMLMELPYEVLLENLPTIAKTQLFEQNETILIQVLSKLGDLNKVIKAKLHPVKFLVHLQQYKRARPLNEKSDREIISKLSSVFSRSLESGEMKDLHACNKKVLVFAEGIRNMTYFCVGSENLSTVYANLGMLLSFLHFEDNCEILTYDNKDFVNLKPHLEKRSDFPDPNEVLHDFEKIDPFLAIEHALHKKIDVDIFVTLIARRDFGENNPKELLQRYRKEMHRPYTQLVTCRMAEQAHSFGDAKDGIENGIYDIFGFDETTPTFIQHIANIIPY